MVIQERKIAEQKRRKSDLYEKELREMATSPMAEAEFVNSNVLASVHPPADYPDFPVPPPPSYPPPAQKVDSFPQKKEINEK